MTNFEEEEEEEEEDLPGPLLVTLASPIEGVGEPYKALAFEDERGGSVDERLRPYCCCCCCCCDEEPFVGAGLFIDDDDDDEDDAWLMTCGDGCQTPRPLRRPAGLTKLTAADVGGFFCKLVTAFVS